jgi:hypothetical protein
VIHRGAALRSSLCPCITIRCIMTANITTACTITRVTQTRMQARGLGQRQNFLQLTPSFQDLFAADLGDCVSAFVDITRGTDAHSMDHSLSVPTVFERATRELMKSSASLDVLSYILSPATFDDSPPLNPLPPWVHCWYCKSRVLMTSVQCRIGCLKLCRTCTDTLLPPDNSATNDQTGVLTLRGVRAEMIE